MDHHRYPYNPQQYNDSRYLPLPPLPNFLPPQPPPHPYYNHPPPPPPPPRPPPQYPPPPPPLLPQYYRHPNQPPHSEPYPPFPPSPRVPSNHARVYNDSPRLRPWGDHDVTSTSLPFNRGVAGYDPHYYRARDDHQQLYPPRVSSIPNLEPSGIHINHISPPFRDIDEFRDWRDDRRVIEDAERGRIQGHYFDEEYHPEMRQGEFAMNPAGGSEFMREPDLVRDGIMMEEDINALRYSDIQAPLVSRDVSCAPIQFRDSNDDRYGEFYEEGEINRGSESGRYYDRGRSRQGTQDYNRTPKKNTRKKSALLRIQPSKHTSFRNRQDTTPSPHKGKESLEGLDNRLSDERDVELDVSFKSNSLVAKAIMSAPAMDPNDSSDLDGLDIRVDSKSLAKADDNRNCTDSSSISRKRGGLSSNKCRSNLESPLKRGSTHRGSPKREISNKDDTNVGLGKVPSFSIRKMRKSNVLLSRLSSSPAMPAVKLENVINSDNHPSGSSISVACVTQAGKESYSNGQVVGPVQNETIIGVEDMDVRGPVIVQAVGHTVPEAPLYKKGREKAVLESHDSSGKLGSTVSKAPGKTKRCAEDIQTVSKTDENVVRSGDKYISNLSTDGHGSQIMVPVLVDNGSGEGSSRQLISMGGNVDDIDIDIVSVDLDIGNSTSGPFGAPVKIPDRVDATCSVDADKPCETHLISSPETGMVEQSCGEERLDRNDNNQNEMKNNGFLLTSSKATITSDKTVTPFSHDDIAVDSEKLTTAHGRKATNDIQEQQCRGEGTMLVNGAESKGTSKAFVSEDVDLTLVSMEEDAPGLVLKRKRKSRNEIQYLNLGISGTSHDVAVSKSGIMVNSNLPVEKSVSIVLGLPCSTAELVLYQKKLKNSCPESISSIHVHDSFAVEHPFHYSKKNKISSLESSDLSASQNYDLPVSSDSLISTAKVGLNSVEHSTQSAEGTEVSNTVLVEKSILGGATNQLQTGRYCFANDSSADFPYGDHCKSVNENLPLDGGLSSFLPKQKGNLNLVMSGAVDGSEPVALESEGRITTSHQRGGIHCMEIDNIGDSVHEPQVMDIGSDDNVAVNDNLPSEPDPPNFHAKGTDFGATTNCDMVTVQSVVGSSEGGSSLIHSSDFRTVSPLTLLSVGKLAVDAERSSKRIVTQGSLSSHSNSIVKSNLTNSKLGISAAPAAPAANQPFAKKYVAPVKNAKITTFPPVNPLSRQFVRRNVLVRADGNSSSIHASPITTPSNKAPSTYPVKPRTWRRTDNLPASNTSVKKLSSSTPLNKPPIDRTIKVQSTSYIRKGNILVRNPIPRAATLGPLVVGATINQSKGNVSNTSKLIGSHEVIESTVVPDSLMAAGRNAHVEMPKTPPLPCSGVISDHEIGYSGHCRSFQPVGEPEAVDNEELTKSFVTTPSSSRNPVTDVDKSLEDPGTLSDGNFPASESKRVVYVKRKSNQLIAASNSTKSSMHMDNTPALSSDNGYYKRRKNQLIRASSESNIQQLVAKVGNSLNSQPQKTLNVYSGRNSTKRQSNKVKPQKVSLVWKLGDTKSSVKGVVPLRCGKLLSHLLPWKRATWRSVWRSSTAFSNNSSLITRKLLSSRKRAAIYVRSGHGFSLRRSKVISLGGSNLKWSKSMEKRSKKADEDASQAIAALHSVQRPKTGASAERIFRIGTFRYRMYPSRRTLQRITDEGSSNPATSKTEYGARKTYVPKRLLIGSDEYVRIGNGNQLVRDPKRRTRLLASEKVRWSLHTARLRLAKKRKFCQFFTRFGKCNKGEGKCPYVHDPSKIAVCTKFLKGLCNDPSCKLTHQVIPERMPDCSFFLQGSCSNENCPYRHVNVNPKAPICESFLRGYCAEGNECRKKHSYICPEFEATGNCPEGSKCKLYHPTKKEGKGKKNKTLKNQTYANSRGRYFRPVVGTTSDPERDMAEKRIAPKGAVLQETEELGDFIGLGVSDDEQNAESMSMLCEGEADLQLDELNELIIPLRLLDSSQGSAIQ